MRNIHFLSKATPSSNVFHASGSSTNVFDAAIAQIQADINRLTDEIFGDNTKGIYSIQSQIDNAYKSLINARDRRDQAPRRSNHPDRVWWQNVMNQKSLEIEQFKKDLTGKTNALNQLRNVDLPKAQALKSQNAAEVYNQTFANKGRDVVSEQTIKKAEADAIRLASESRAMVEQATQKASSEIAARSAKTTRNIIILIVVAIVITSTIIIIKKRKSN